MHTISSTHYECDAHLGVSNGVRRLSNCSPSPRSDPSQASLGRLRDRVSRSSEHREGNSYENRDRSVPARVPKLSAVALIPSVYLRERIETKMKGSPGLVVLSALLLFTACVVSPAVGRTESLGTVPAAKIRSFEVLGIHLGMKPAEVDAALAKNGYSLTTDPTTPGDLTHSWFCVSDYIGALREGRPASTFSRDPGSGGNCVYWQQPAYHGNVLSGRNLLIYYCEDYPAHPGTMRVVAITFKQPLQTDADAQSSRRAVFSRMGLKPTWVSNNGNSGSYCSFKYSTDHMALASDSSPCGEDGTLNPSNPGYQHVDDTERGVTLDYSAAAGGEFLGLQDRDFIIIHRTASNKAIEATHTPAKTPF